MKIKNLLVSKYTLPVQIKPEKAGGFLAICPAWDACFAQADTVEEVIKEVYLAAKTLIEFHQEKNLPIPLKVKRSPQASSQGFSFTFPVLIPSH